MQTKLSPYINFKKETREAMTFYHSVFGGKLTMSTFKDYHVEVGPGEEDLIMHSQLEIKSDMTLMASDSPARMDFRPGNNFSITLSGDDEAELTDYFQKLSQGGVITQPLVKAIWGDSFGMCVDRFGVSWLVNISAK